MSTKTINGAYPAGYALNPIYQALQIGLTASVGGNGVTTGAGQPSAIINYGEVKGTGNGITLSDGGAITNQASGSTLALIKGQTAILAQGGFAVLLNAGTIKSTSATSDYATTVDTSVVFKAGGYVAQTVSGATIANGVSISGGVGTVVNRGTIGGATYDRLDPRYQAYYRTETYRRDPSVTLLGGGKVNNGANGVTSATLSSGVSISGGQGLVINNGTIDGSVYNSYGYDIYKHVYASVVLSGGGTIRNGTGSNTTATLTNGITLSGGATTVVNNGTIGYGTFHYTGGHVDATFPTASIASTSALTLTNGSAINTGAMISGGVTVSGATATITNFGTIESPTDIPYTPSSFAMVLAGGGTVVNGSSAVAATISGRNGIEFSGSGTITNFGTISGGSAGRAIVFTKGTATLIEEGTGIITGKVAGDGQTTLVLGGDAGAGSFTSLGINVTGFASTAVASGASWTLTGTNKVASGTSLVDHGKLKLASTLTNQGTVEVGGSLVINAAGKLNNQTSASTLVLDTGSGIAGVGSIVNAGTIVKATGGDTVTVATTIVNAGTIEVAQGGLRITADVTGTGGSLVLDTGRTLELGGKVLVGQTASFAGSGATLLLDNAQAFAGQIDKLAGTNAVDLARFKFSGAETFAFKENAAKTNGVLTVTSGTDTAKLTILGNHATAGFTLATDGNGGTAITYASPAVAKSQFSTIA